MAFAARPASTVSHARLRDLISSMRSVSFLTSIQSTLASSETHLRVQCGLVSSKTEETGRLGATAVPFPPLPLAVGALELLLLAVAAAAACSAFCLSFEMSGWSFEKTETIREKN